MIYMITVIVVSPVAHVVVVVVGFAKNTSLQHSAKREVLTQ